MDYYMQETKKPCSGNTKEWTNRNWRLKVPGLSMIGAVHQLTEPGWASLTNSVFSNVMCHQPWTHHVTHHVSSAMGACTPDISKGYQWGLYPPRELAVNHIPYMTGKGNTINFGIRWLNSLPTSTTYQFSTLGRSFHFSRS